MTLLNWAHGLCGGLLISSCCIIQLFLNIFGIGCAGLNTLLLPYRPLFISLTIVSLTYAFLRSRPSKWHLTAIISMTLFLSFSPELLRIYNNGRSAIVAQDHEIMISTQWQIKGMHCEACRTAVIRAIQNIDGVQNIHVDLQTSQATVTSNRKVESKTIVKTVQSAGFDVEQIS
jgi:copper chaperone CopZ